MDLKREFEDRLVVFKLASMCKYEPVMEYQFSKMIQNLSDIRARSRIKRERTKNKWNDPELHFARIQEEEAIDLNRKKSDLSKLYEIAKSANYTNGMLLISDELSKIAHRTIKDISKKLDIPDTPDIPTKHFK